MDTETRQAMIPSAPHKVHKNAAEAIASLDSDEVLLAREVPLGSVTSICLCVLLISTDVARSCLSYSMKHFNDNVYPVHPTLVVTATEVLKAAVVITCHLYYDGDNPFKKINPKILIPCTLYALTNNLFFFALYFVTPAIWIVLCQMRVIVLLIMYRFHLKQNITTAQYTGALVLMVGVGLAQMDVGADFRTIVGPALGIAAVSSVMSATAGLFIELVLKKGGTEGIWRNQSHLYCGSALISIVPVFVSLYVLGNKAIEIRKSWKPLVTTVPITVLLATINGIVVSMVIKKLDNVVRFQMSAVTYIITAGANKVMFPETFHLSFWYVASIVVIISAMFLIERKKFGSCVSSTDDLETNPDHGRISDCQSRSALVPVLITPTLFRV